MALLTIRQKQKLILGCLPLVGITLAVGLVIQAIEALRWWTLVILAGIGLIAWWIRSSAARSAP